ncbi:polyamine ABC transporter substrate-binding protein [Pseudoroseicyclus tamaricis]|uniref:Putrescine-binding periplasmic protein n=1 Tax=Pseudoroseicyclus tamaricis TaxID=2705421 RepID=A0A6B2JQB5_9RHOB|nr:polyamine ABC transporter substrate-binding protein [Pseudoroseicyclus tamaricis]NDV00220.1 polyamine ABC transporter substrate-binding protein [Pseudoroseicyclus tamaricis]
MRLNRRKTLGLMGGGLAMPWVRPSYAQSGSLYIYNWADYIGETTLEDFENEFGIEPVYDTYSSSEEMQAKMLAGMTGYDVVFHAGMDMPRSIQAGIYQKLDKSKLTNWGNLDTEILAILAGWDPGNEYTVPYMWGSVGITFNVDMVRERLPDADLADMSIILDPENAAALADCGISILDSPTDVLLMTLPYLGIDGNTKDVADYEKVVEAFRPVREYIRTFDNTNYLNAIPNGELCVINNWSGDYGVAAGRAEEAGIEMNLAYYVPKTGAPAWFDVMALTSDSANVENAHTFMNYMLRPEVIAACTNYTWYANANAAADEFVDPSILNNPAVYPDAENTARLYAPDPFTEEQDRAINRAWQAIKAGG